MKKYEIIFGIICVLLVIFWFINIIITGSTSKKIFYNETISSKVVNSKMRFARYMKFLLEDGKTICFMPPINDKIWIGDSISKGDSTFIYDVYRKDTNGVYYYYTTYDAAKTN